MRATATPFPEGSPLEAIWQREKAKMEETFTILEFDEEKFNRFCDDIIIDKPKYLEQEGITPEQVRESHVTFIPAEHASNYHIIYNTGDKTPIFLMLANDGKARYVCWKIIKALNLKYPGMVGT